MEYPKIHSLYKRESHGKRQLIIGDLAKEEFRSIIHWTVTEKVDGTNIRICLDRATLIREGHNYIKFGGRTNNAQIPSSLLEYLQATFTYEKMDKIFADSQFIVLFGEGYGPKIQSGGYYRSDVSFILFDAYVSGWWLERDKIVQIAHDLGIDHVPLIPSRNVLEPDLWNLYDIVSQVRSKPQSALAKECYIAEGIVARSYPLMLFRNGEPIMFKLKCKDFP